jgi:hypothetical protein
MNSFVGQWKNGKMDGEGKLTYFNWVYYQGHFKEGKQSGKGKFVWKNGEKYKGDFDNGHRNGFGVLTYSKESEINFYEGHWKDDRFHKQYFIIITIQ